MEDHYGMELIVDCKDSGQEYHLTAYGEDLVEAMPDRKKVKAVHRKHSRLNRLKTKGKRSGDRSKDRL